MSTITREDTPGSGDRGGTRQRLLDAASRALEGNPAGPVRLHDVLAEAGASPSSLYHFFGSLSGLVQEAKIARYEEASLIAAFDAFRTSVLEARSRDEFVDALDAYLEHLAGSTRTPARRARASAVLAAANDDEVGARLWDTQKLLYAALIEVLETAVGSGFVPGDVDVAGVVHYSDALFFGYLLSETLDREDLRRHWFCHARDSIYVALYGAEGFAISRRS